MQRILLLSPLLGTPKMQGLRSIPAPLWAREKAVVGQPILTLSQLKPPKQKYHAPCRPPPPPPRPPYCNFCCAYICNSK